MRHEAMGGETEVWAPPSRRGTAVWTPPRAPRLPDDEEQLIELARTDRDAFAELYRRHGGAGPACVPRLGGTRQAAEDITSATFERALCNIGQFRSQGSGLRPWLLSIASNEMAGWYRRESRADRPRTLAPTWRRDREPGEDPDVDLGVDGAAMTRMRRVLGSLPEHHQQVIALRLVAGLSADEVARQLSCSKPALAVRLHRAVSALRKAMNLEEVAR
jgi:RNA polymerase sigma-70 factor (ECF subfamily)